MFDVRKSNSRGVANHGWLNSKHTFSFGQYYDPTQQGFSDLRVINDDQVQPSRGFGTHSHNNMEIFTYVLTGALAHKDSMGTGSVIKPGDVQMMSAGTGISHSEFNASEAELVHFLQIWVVPNQQGVKPRYQQVHFDEASKRGRLRLIISPEGEDGSLSVYQDAKVYAGLFDGDETAEYHLAANRYAYIHVARGELEINGYKFEAGDGVRVRKQDVISFSNGKQAEVLLFDLRPNELPTVN
jgi:redox-sensitive bicupin YhaK (pirin superfamily)